MNELSTPSAPSKPSPPRPAAPRARWHVRCAPSRCAVFVGVLLALSTARVSAQSSDAPPVPTDGPLGAALTASQVVARALAANPGLRAAALEHVRATALVTSEQARYGLTLAGDAGLNIGNTPTLTRSSTGTGAVNVSYNEQVTLGAELRRGFETGTALTLRAQGARQFRRAVFVPTLPPIEVGPGYAFDVTLGITQPLLRGFGERIGLAALRQARIDEDRARATQARTASELVRDTLIAYWDLWYAQSALRVRESDRDLARAQLAEAEARASLGALSRADVLAFATRAAAGEEGVVAAHGEVRARSIELSRLLGGAEVDGLDAAEPALPDQRGSASGAVARALTVSPAVRELEARVALAQEASRTAGAGLEPRLDLSGQLGVHGLGYDDVGQTFSQLGTFAAVTGLVQLSFELPLDDTQSRMEVERARLALEVAARQLDSTRQQLEAAVLRFSALREAAEARLALAERTAQLAGELATAEQERFDAGARTAISVTQADNEERDARLRALRARVDLVSADLQLAHLEDALLDEDLEPR